MFSHCRMSAGREIQVEQQQPVRCVCEERPAAEHRKSAEPDMVLCMGLYQLAEIRSVAVCVPHLVSSAHYSRHLNRYTCSVLQRTRHANDYCRPDADVPTIQTPAWKLPPSIMQVLYWTTQAQAGSSVEVRRRRRGTERHDRACRPSILPRVSMHKNDAISCRYARKRTPCMKFQKKKSVMIPRAWSINARGAKTQICSNPNVVYKFIIIIIYFVKRWTLRHARLVYCDTVCTVTIGFLHYIL